jgi:ABC-type uncharacterized transport system auxiliary subunit
MKKLYITSLGLISMIVSSCGTFSPVKLPTTQKYVIDYNSSYVSCGTTKPNSIYLKPTTANPPYNTTDMLYSSSSYSINQYSYSVWATSPSNYVQAAINQSLHNSCLFNQIYSSEFNGKAAYQLNSKIINLQQVLGDNTATVNLTINVELVNNQTGAIIARQFSYNWQTTPSPENFAAGTSHNLASFTKELNQWLGKQIH